MTRARRGLPGGVSVLVVLGLVMVATVGRGAAPHEFLGVADPGALVRQGTPVLRMLVQGCAALCAGSLVMAAFVAPSGRSGALSADGYAAARLAGGAALGWAVGAVVLAVFTTANGTGNGLGVLARPGLGDAMVALGEPVAWLVSAAVATVMALICGVTLRWGPVVAATALAVPALMPPVVTGHAASGAGHDLATEAAVLHVAGAAVWSGALVAVLAHLARRRPQAELVLSRYRALAMVCAAAVVGSGGLLAVLYTPAGAWTATSFGWMALAKLVLAAGAIAATGALRRRLGRTSPSGAGTATRVAALELVLLAVALAVAVSMSQDVPPSFQAGQDTEQEVLLGYNLGGPPTVLRLLLDWRVNALFALVAVALAVGYLAGVHRLRRRGDRWPPGRTTAWLLGCGVLLITTSSGIGRYSMAMFSVHMGNHMLLSMVVPVLLVLGGPVTLALRALPPSGAERPDGPREWLVRAVQSRAARVATHPVLALVLFVGSFYALYFSPLFALALPFHWGHLLMNAHFVLVGYLFFWPIVGVDPSPWRLPHLGRLGVLLASMPFHAFFGVILMSGGTVVGAHFYGMLDLPWVDLLADQRVGGGIAWASGEVPLLIVIVALMAQWSRHDARAGTRADRRAERDGDADLEAWNAMLARLSATPR